MPGVLLTLFVLLPFPQLAILGYIFPNLFWNVLAYLAHLSMGLKSSCFRVAQLYQRCWMYTLVQKYAYYVNEVFAVIKMYYLRPSFIFVFTFYMYICVC